MFPTISLQAEETGKEEVEKKYQLVKKLNASISYSSTSDDSISSSNHLSQFGFGGTIGFLFETYGLIGLSTDLRLVSQYSSPTTVGENFKGLFWNYASLNLSRDVNNFSLSLDLHFFGKHQLDNKSNLGNDVSYSEPRGAKFSAVYPLPLHHYPLLNNRIKMGGTFEWISFSKMTVGPQEFDANRTLWQLGVVFSYDF